MTRKSIWTIGIAAAWVAVLAGVLIAQEAPRADLHGVVLARENGKPVPGARVAARGIERSWWRDVKADEQGRFTLRDVPAGLAGFTASGNVHQMLKERRYEVRESPSNRLTLVADPVAPFLRVRASSGGRMQFTPDEPATLSVSGFSNNRRLGIEVRRLSLSELRDRREDAVWGGEFRVPRGVGTPVAGQARVIDPAPRDAEGRIEQRLQLQLPPGLYSVWADLPDAADGVVVSVSRIGLVTKFDGRQALGYVQDLIDNRPVQGAAVQLLYAGKVAASGRTDAQGLFRTAAPSGDAGECRLVAQLGDSFAFTETYSPYLEDQGDYRVYLYTDRPVYRPGQRVYFKGIVRERRGADYRVPAREPVHLTLHDAAETQVFAGDFTTNEFGSFSGELTLASDAAVGLYRATATIRGQEDTGYFSVAEYRKPEYEIEVKPEQPNFVRGEPVRFTVTARYYWGEPVRNARVSYTLTRSPKWYFPDDEESDFLAEFYPAGGGEEDQSGYGEEADYGEGVTDASGRFTLRVTPRLPENDTQDYVYQLEAEITDPGRLPASGRGSALVTRGTFRLELTPDRWVLPPGETAALRLRAVDYQNRPQAGLPVALLAGEQEVARVTTDAQGRARVNLPVTRKGDLELTAKARDRLGNEVSQRETLWVTDGSFSAGDYGYAGLEVIPDRQTYRPGDTAQVLINVNEPGGTALVTLEGERLYETRVVPLTAKSNLERIPIRREYLPNVYVSVVTVRGRRFDHQDRMLRVSPQDYALNVSVTPDRQRVGPREPVTFTVRATDRRGRPVDAEVSLGLVDEAIYAIREDRALDGIQYFYRYQQNQVQTVYSFPEIYLADEPKDGGPTEIRKDFPDTARWFPAVRTGPTGVAKVSVRLPDSLTTWRATVRAHTRATQVGAAVAKVVASKELFVRLETPRFLTQNDRSVVSTIVHNDTDRPRQVQVALAATGVRLSGSSRAAVLVAPHDSVRTDWPVSVSAAGEAVFTATAVSDGPRDGVEKRIPVMPHGSESRSGRSGSLNGSAVDLPLELPAGAIGPATHCEVTVSATPAGVLLQALDYMHAHDYGTTENTVGWFLPDMTVAMTFRELGFRYPPLEQRLKTGVRTSLARLYRLQGYGDGKDKNTGGWGWAAGAEEDPFWTAYALYGLVQAKRAGYAVDAAAVTRGRNALDRLLPREKDPSNRALICYVLTRAGHVPSKAMLDLERRLPELHSRVKNYAIALLALALADAGEMPRARKVAGELTRSVKQEGDQAWWPEIYDWGFYSCNDNETTGYAMMALIRTDPKNPLIDRAARWLIAKRQGDGWASTEDTASIIYALGAYLQRQRRLSPPDYTATITVNDQPAGSVRMTAATMLESRRVVIPVERLRPGANQVGIERQGSGPLMYGLSLKTFVQAEDLRAETAGLEVRREYFRRLRLRDIHGNEFDRMVPAGTTFHSGDELYARVTVVVRDRDRKGRCREVIVRDPLPAGCEALDESAEDSYYYDDGSGDWWTADERRREVRDREVVFYAAALHPGANVFHYRLRAIQPGEYHVLPARAGAAYIPEIAGRSEEVRVTIRE